jgi:hypothetical protein
MCSSPKVCGIFTWRKRFVRLSAEHESPILAQSLYEALSRRFVISGHVPNRNAATMFGWRKIAIALIYSLGGDLSENCLAHFAFFGKSG